MIKTKLEHRIMAFCLEPNVNSFSMHLYKLKVLHDFVLGMCQHWKFKGFVEVVTAASNGTSLWETLNRECVELSAERLAMCNPPTQPCGTMEH